MGQVYHRTLFLLLLTSSLVGCGLNTVALQKGGNGRMGVLLNYSCGAQPCDAIDPSKPTIVVTHGWNPLPKRIRTTFGHSVANAIKCRCGDTYNLLSWDWNGVSVPPFNHGPQRVGRCQGQMMAAALRARGVEPGNTQMIGHSLGTLVVAHAACCLSDLGPTAQLTLLDPPRVYHKEVFVNLHATQHAQVVENYWAPGVSGFGADSDCRGVRNIMVPGTTPLRGIVDLSVSNHINVMLWFHKTICCPSIPCGFQSSVFIDQCGCEPCCPQVSSRPQVSNIELSVPQ